MQRVLRALVVACMLAACVRTSAAWGKDGHKITAQIAWNFVSTSVQNAIQTQLANGVTLADIAGLPDNYDHTDEGKWSAEDHYIDIPAHDNTFIMSQSSCTGDCVVDSVYNYTTILTKEAPNWPVGVCKTDGSSEPCPLSFLTHYVGDCHQPMHVAYTDDRGGNQFSVSFYGYTTNLHSVWDGQIISRYLNNSKWTVLATELTNWANAHSTQRAWIQRETVPQVWANESFNIVKNEAYNFIPGYGGIGGKPVPHTSSDLEETQRQQAAINDIPSAPIRPLGDSEHHSGEEDESCHRSKSARSVEATYTTYIGDPYYERSLPIVKARLVEGGLRLAYLLTTIYG
eukprot:TRINITY_DN1389_c0_g1_i1.p1 TRINITY_DN1389_c0_g1~~TRINITY_DN1389_c0_g1_i1.p1  ORF type:complete len:343 (+),score=86.09 TRINITY_DN1389_c0_g1_i1:132-1160(+)